MTDRRPTMDEGPDAALRRAELRRLGAGCTNPEALAFYDSLPPVTVRGLLGAWRGSTLRSGHPLDGLLEACGWRGKRFDSADAAHPLVFEGRRGRWVFIDPARIPVGLVVRLAPWVPRRAAGALFRLAWPLLRTRRPRARVRRVEYRGVLTATMVYDARPVNDAFRAVDADTLIGAMDMRGMAEPFLFVLRREAPTVGDTPAPKERGADG